jgi:A/G-specific adenine glycosylase
VHTFASALVAWQRTHGRRGLPWQQTRDPYRVWLSEIMLQQTQVAAVIPFYERFLVRFPDLAALAGATEEEVLELWSGLGYYARGRNLLRAAKQVAGQGGFPDSAEKIALLPGVGRSTAAAIAAFCYGERAAILDGNVKRVLARRFGIEGWPGERSVEAQLWTLADKLVPAKEVQTYTQALMDLGATVCLKVKPHCDACPVRRPCVARKGGTIESIPASRPKTELPRRAATWLILRQHGQVLLEKRPSAGLWGGLWTFPVLEQLDAAGYCRRSFGCEISAPKKLATLEHGFTHFRLSIQPLLCEVARASARAQSPGRLWIDLHAARGAAIPVPVRKLIERLAGKH